MKTSVAAALAGLAMASTPTLGADLFGTAPPPMTFPASQSPITEVGSNWYLRGDLGFDLDQAPSFSMAAISMPTGAGFLPFSSALRLVADRTTISPADIGVGYRYNNWLRFEGTYEYRTAAAGAKNTNSVLCPTALRTAGRRPDAHRLRLRSDRDRHQRLHRRPRPHCGATRRRSPPLILISAIIWGVTPYVGGGLGLNADMISGNVGYTVNSTAPPTAPTLLGRPATVPQVVAEPRRAGPITQPNIGFTNRDWNRSISVDPLQHGLGADGRLRLSSFRPARRSTSAIAISTLERARCWSLPRPGRRSSCPTCRRTSASASATWPTDCGGRSPGRSLDADGVWFPIPAM